MATFRSAKTQAAHAVKQKSAIGSPRHGNRDDGRIHSSGTARTYTEALACYTTWLQQERLGSLHSSGRNEALQYLSLRSTEVSQAQLDKDRQAIQAVLGEQLPRLKSDVESIRSSRLYTPEQLALVSNYQTPRNALATALVEATGIRAHELLTIRPVAEQPRSNHRQWRSDLHAGREGNLYSVVGKGGLKREILINFRLAELLESTRHATPQTVVDRSVRYTSHYDIGGGQAWSQSFAAASKRALEWSAGGHAIRATWACNHVASLQASGYSLEEAKAVCSQNLGHFSPATVDYYLNR